jgi:hypothetical protein
MIRQFNNLLDILERTVAQSLEREARRRDAQLEALQYQINPHFIYNSMYFLRLSMEKEGLWELARADCVRRQDCRGHAAHPKDGRRHMLGVGLYGDNGHQIQNLLKGHGKARLAAVAGFSSALLEGEIF